MQHQFRLMSLVLAVALAGSGCDGKPHHSDNGLEVLADWLSGVMDSSAQAEQDEQYFNIRLAATPIWPDREDGIWLYLEQASATDLRHPYRQRIYHLHESERGQFVSDVYTLPDPDTAIGSWRNPDVLEEYGPDDLQLRAGCSVYLRREDALHFAGATRGRECSSDLNGADYATSEVVVTAQGIDSWDRGFNAQGEQVWGALNGPYQFRRKS